MLIFSNPGLLDPRSILTFGVNAKSSPSAIGHFGTGLKYSIASILRAGGTITIYSGPNQYSFLALPDTIRGKEFHFVHMESLGEAQCTSTPCGFTTELGKEWKPWMVFRELWSNCMDESGAVGRVGGDRREALAKSIDFALIGHTVIHVSWPELEEVYSQRAHYILESSIVPLATSPTLEILPRIPTYPAIYPMLYRGIRVAEFPHVPVFTYNLLAEQRLTEDRTLDSWTYGYHVAQGISQLTDGVLLDQILQAAGNTWEHLSLDFSSIKEPTPQFRSAVHRASLAKVENASARRRMMVLSPADFLPPPLTPTADECLRIAQGLALLECAGMEHEWAETRVVNFLDDYTQIRELKVAGEPTILYISRTLLGKPDPKQFFRELFQLWSNADWSNDCAARFVSYLWAEREGQPVPTED